MGIKKKLGINTPKAVLLAVQIILTLFLLAVSIYLLVFVPISNRGGWMIVSYVQITISALALLMYFAIGHRKGKPAYYLAILPF